jgi:hypothetical protein
VGAGHLWLKNLAWPVFTGSVIVWFSCKAVEGKRMFPWGRTTKIEHMDQQKTSLQRNHQKQ